MDYENYCYHGSKHVTAPRSTTGNIKGLELEISDYDCGDILDEMIEEDILTVPCNENIKKEVTIAVEDDGSVYKELIFKASCNQTLLKGVKKLEEYLNGNVDNGHGTSCHIHLNNKYLETLNLTGRDITKSAEFLAPLLYKISGRTKNSLSDWCQSVLSNEIDIDNDNLYDRCQLIDHCITNYNGRYSLVNVCDKTTELRIFSNYYNFNYNYIKTYIECCDFIIELATYMKEKNYIDEYNNIINMTKHFFQKRKYKEIYERHELDAFFMSLKEKQLNSLKKQLSYINDKINELKQMMGYQNEEMQRNNAIRVLRFLRNYKANYNNIPNFDYNVLEPNLNEIENILTENIRNQIEQIEEQEE